MSLVIYSDVTYSLQSGGNLRFNIGGIEGTFGLERTGHVLWDGCFELAKYLESIPLEIKNKKILEIGCGVCAIPGQVACALQGNVIVTDIADEIPFINANLELNKHLHQGTIESKSLEWSTAHKEEFRDLITGIDLILCADLLFADTFGPLLNLILVLFQYSPNATLLMANVDRLQVHKFKRNQIVKSNFEITEIPLTNPMNNINMFSLKKLDRSS